MHRVSRPSATCHRSQIGVVCPGLGHEFVELALEFLFLDEGALHYVSYVCFSSDGR